MGWSLVVAMSRRIDQLPPTPGHVCEDANQQQWPNDNRRCKDDESNECKHGAIIEKTPSRGRGSDAPRNCCLDELGFVHRARHQSHGEALPGPLSGHFRSHPLATSYGLTVSLAAGFRVCVTKSRCLCTLRSWPHGEQPHRNRAGPRHACRQRWTGCRGPA